MRAVKFFRFSSLPRHPRERERERGMEWEQERSNGGNGSGEGDGVLGVVLMTKEQVGELARQISAYATICEQLVGMYKAVTAQQDSHAGMRLGSLYCDPLIMSVGHKNTVRRRWTPTPLQLQLLESIFKKGFGTPSKQMIRDLTSDLSQHGQISESNVYNWFQNRRARSKRKQTAILQNNTDSEVEAEDESSNEKAKSDKTRGKEILHQGINDQLFQSTINSSDVHFLDPVDQLFLSIDNSSDMHFLDPDSIRTQGTYENALSSPRDEHFMERMKFP